MNKINIWIKEHQVTTFFIFAFAITWPLFFLIYFAFPGNPLVLILAGGPLAVFSPALAAIFISAIIEPQPKQQTRKPRLIALGVSWLISWIIMTLYYWQVVKLDLSLAAILWAIFALLPAWILSSAYARTPGIRKHFSSLLRPRGNFIWYLVALLTVPVLQFMGVIISQLLGIEVQFHLDMKLGDEVIFLSLTFFSGFLCSGGINEESGWRGFALPRLQQRYPVILAAGIIWFFWALWHIPYDIGLRTPVEMILFNRIVNNFIFSILFAWVYNRTKGSILAPALFHPSMNTFGNHFPVTPITLGLFAALAIFAIIYDKMWEKLPSDNPAVYQEPKKEVIGALKGSIQEVDDDKTG